MTSIYDIIQEVHPDLISILRDMDIDYVKNLVPYNYEVVDPIIDQLVVDLEWVTAIKKAPGGVSLEHNEESGFGVMSL